MDASHSVALPDKSSKEDLAGELNFKRAKLECMRNMATVAGYSFGASFMVYQHPPIFGRQTLSAIIGLLLFGIALWGATSAAQLFMHAVLEHYPQIRGSARSNRRSRLAVFGALMAWFLCLVAVPYLIVIGMPHK